MEASCPHLGADMSHAEIEEYDTGVVAVCPWHRLRAPKCTAKYTSHHATLDMTLIYAQARAKPG